MPITQAATITPKQLQMLKLIKQFQQSQPYSATIQELAGHLRVSRTTAFEHVAALKEKALLRAVPGKARSLKLTVQARRLLDSFLPAIDNPEQAEDGLPLLGRVAAGAPIEAIQNTEYISLRSEFGTADDTFILQVVGDSMIDENINDGDFVICKKTQTARDGQLVVAIVDDDNATVKRFYKESDRVRLEPANKNYEPIYSNNCRIDGLVIGLMRKL